MGCARDEMIVPLVYVIHTPSAMKGMMDMAKCEICGKSPMFGNNVPHSHHKTKRRWNPNVQRVTITEGGRSRKVYICAKCLRTMNKTTGR